MKEQKNSSTDDAIKNVEVELGEVRDQLEEVKKLAQENLAGWQRAQADYANFKKETEKRQKDVVEFANASFVAEVLPVYGHFKMALDHVPKEQENLDWVIGIKFIKKQFEDFLQRYGIEEIKTVGEKFDHNLHEAISHEEKEGFESDVIFEEVQAGYRLNGQVLMPAKVKVAK